VWAIVIVNTGGQWVNARSRKASNGLPSNTYIYCPIGVSEMASNSTDEQLVTAEEDGGYKLAYRTLLCVVDVIFLKSKEH